MKFEVVELSKDKVVEILSSMDSFYGIQYWTKNYSFNQELYNNIEGDTYEDKLAEMLMKHPKEAKLILKTWEGDKHELTYEKLKKGLAIAVNNKYITLEHDCFDGPAADSIVQCSLFEELVYG